jgi:hypothetical protein
MFTESRLSRRVLIDNDNEMSDKMTDGLSDVKLHLVDNVQKANDFILNDDRIKKQMQNSSDLFERTEYTCSYIDISNNTYLPYKYEEYKDFLNKCE